MNPSQTALCLYKALRCSLVIEWGIAMWLLASWVERMGNKKLILGPKKDQISWSSSLTGCVNTELWGQTEIWWKAERLKNIIFGRSGVSRHKAFTIQLYFINIRLCIVPFICYLASLLLIDVQCFRKLICDSMSL